jgi:hypothetical protein
MMDIRDTFISIAVASASSNIASKSLFIMISSVFYPLFKSLETPMSIKSSKQPISFMKNIVK